MKMRTKKCGAIALAAVLLIAAALVTSCIDPIDLGGLTVPQSGAPADFTPTPTPASTPVLTPISASTPVVFEPSDPVQEVGYIQLSISIPESGARTIFPNTSAITGLSSFDNYSILILNASNVDITSGEHLEATPGAGGVFTAIDVAPGSYTVQVFGNKGTGTSRVSYAAGSATTGTVAAAATVPVSIALTEIVDGKGDGKFAWNLTPASVTPATAVTMTIVGLSTPANGIAATTITSNLNNTASPIDIKSGYYRVEIEQTRDDHKTVKTVSSLHVYQGFTSTFIYTFPDLKLNNYTVTYNLNGSSATTHPATKALHGTYLPKPNDPTYPGDATKEFSHWTLPDDTTVFGFNDNETSGTFVSNDLILGAITLKAQWNTVTTGNIVVTVTGVGITDLTVNEPIPTFTSPAEVSVEGATFTITLSNAVTFDGGYYWLDEDNVQVDAYDNAPFVFNTATVGNKILGIYMITVVGTKSTIEYTTEVRIEVTVGP